MASSSSKRKHAGSHEEAAELVKNALMLMKMAKDDDVNSKSFIDQATMAIGPLQDLLTSTKQDKVTRDQITWEITTCDPKHEDEYNWEKYGTKKIKEFNDYPKDYYNCSNKRKNGCPAKKHVQQVKSHEYRVIYYGSHTCGGNQNQQQQHQQHHSPPLVPSEHGSASTAPSPNISSSIRATPRQEPAGQSDEVDDYLSSWEIIKEVDGIQNHHHQQQRSPLLDPSEHGSATVQIPDSSSSVRATPSCHESPREPAGQGQNDEDDSLWNQCQSIDDDIDWDSSYGK